MKAAMRCGLVILALVFGVDACSSSNAGLSTASLAGKTFVSTQVIGHDLVAGTKVTLGFEGSTMTASAGCNTMSADYTLDNSTLRWTTQPRSTLIGCPPASDAQDQWLTMFLQTGARASLTDSRLSLASGQTTMQLQAQ